MKECTVGEGLFGGTPGSRGYGAECLEVKEELCSEGMDMRTKEKGSVKDHAKDLGAELNKRGRG